MSINDIMNYIGKEDVVINPVVLKQMITSVASGGPDLSQVTATADKILSGYKSVDNTGALITGTCVYNAKIPDEASTIDPSEWGNKDGQKCLVLVDGNWVIQTVDAG